MSHAEPVALYAAGSLREALDKTAAAFAAATGVKVDQLAVGADYGLTVMNAASSEAWRFAFFILSNNGQRILAHHGFAAPGLLH